RLSMSALNAALTAAAVSLVIVVCARAGEAPAAKTSEASATAVARRGVRMWERSMRDSCEEKVFNVTPLRRSMPAKRFAYSFPRGDDRAGPRVLEPSHPRS